MERFCRLPGTYNSLVEEESRIKALLGSIFTAFQAERHFIEVTDLRLRQYIFMIMPCSVLRNSYSDSFFSLI